MDHQVGDTFESIESAHDFVRLLSEAVAEAKQDIAADVKREQATSKATRRLDALRIALYSLEKLELYMSKSQLILNDLRTLRRLVFEERLASTQNLS
jgi:predicted nucleic acid-binding protein